MEIHAVAPDEIFNMPRSGRGHSDNQVFFKDIEYLRIINFYIPSVYKSNLESVLASCPVSFKSLTVKNKSVPRDTCVACHDLKKSVQTERTCQG